MIRRQKKYTQNLNNSNYKRPVGGTKTDRMQTTKDMKKKLKDYELVKDIDNVPYNTHIRYVTWKDGTQKFRIGGKLIKKERDYIKLANNDFHWSVQKKHYDQSGVEVFKTVFFKKISQDQINRQIISEMQREIERLKKENQYLRHKLNL